MPVPSTVTWAVSCLLGAGASLVPALLIWMAVLAGEMLGMGAWPLSQMSR